MSDTSKSLGKNLLALLLIIYLLPAQLLACYYWYKDVKENDGFVRAMFWSPLVGIFKATHWPYYVFFTKDETAQRSTETPASLRHFQNTMSYMKNAHSLLTNLGSKDAAKEAENVKYLFKKALSEANAIDTKELDKIKPGMGNAVRVHLIPAIKIYDGVLSGTKDKSEIAYGDIELAKFSDWMEAHAND